MEGNSENAPDSKRDLLLRQLTDRQDHSTQQHKDLMARVLDLEKQMFSFVTLNNSLRSQINDQTEEQESVNKDLDARLTRMSSRVAELENFDVAAVEGQIKELSSVSQQLADVSKLTKGLQTAEKKLEVLDELIQLHVSSTDTVLVRLKEVVKKEIEKEITGPMKARQKKTIEGLDSKFILQENFAQFEAGFNSQLHSCMDDIERFRTESDNVE